jgi:anion-transporting  ArsA/GET3 family ATPase
MTLTLEDLKDKLKQVDNVILLEVLEISSDELVEAFVEHIEQLYDQLVTDFDDEDENEQEEQTG